MGLDQQSIAQVVFQIGQSSDNSYTKGKSAQLLYTNPSSDTTKTSWLAQGFIDFGYTFNSKHGKLSITANAEMHKNNLINKEQDTRQLGGALDFKKTLKDKDGVAKSMLNPTLTIKHSKDRVKKEEGMQYIFGITYYPNIGGSSEFKSIFVPDTYFSLFNKGLGFSTNYNLGAAIATIDTDPLSFLQADISIDTYLLPRLFEQLVDNYRLIFGSYSYNGRLELKNDSNKELDGLQKIGFGLDFSLINLAKVFNSKAKSDNNKFTIKQEWISGADPLKGLDNQKYSQVTLNVLVKF